MGHTRTAAWMVAWTALACAAQAVRAAPAEPLIVADLKEPVLQVVVMRDPEADAIDEETRRFAKALDDATLARRQAIAQQCQRIAEVPAAGSAREAWAANCRYTRR